MNDIELMTLGGVAAGGAALLGTWLLAARNQWISRRAKTVNDLATRVDNVLTAQRQLLADTSHELRTPLTTIRGNLDLLERELPAAERAEVLAETREEVDRMARLIRDLLLLAESGAGTLEIERVPVRLDLLAQEVIDRTSGSTRVTFDAEPVMVHGDDERLRQLIGNLIQNAVRHATSEVRVSVRRRPPTAVLEVEDDGPGLPPDALARVFDRFYRVDRGRSRAHGGAGLGLASVRHVAEEHGGRAWAANRSDQPGAMFIVELPAEPSWVSDAVPQSVEHSRHDV